MVDREYVMAYSEGYTQGSTDARVALLEAMRTPPRPITVMPFDREELSLILASYPAGCLSPEQDALWKRIRAKAREVLNLG